MGAVSSPADCLPPRNSVTVEKTLCGGSKAMSAGQGAIAAAEHHGCQRPPTWRQPCPAITPSLSKMPTPSGNWPKLSWKWRRSDLHKNQAAVCCGWGCGYVGDAMASSKLAATASVISTAVGGSAPIIASRQIAIGARFPSA